MFSIFSEFCSAFSAQNYPWVTLDRPGMDPNELQWAWVGPRLTQVGPRLTPVVPGLTQVGPGLELGGTQVRPGLTFVGPKLNLG